LRDFQERDRPSRFAPSAKAVIPAHVGSQRRCASSWFNRSLDFGYDTRMSARDWWRDLRARFTRTPQAEPSGQAGSGHVAQASEALRALLDDPSIPAAVRGE
jgi:hypothetical protein